MHNILVTYATRAGSTADIAMNVAKVLSEAGVSVDVLPIQAVRDVNGYNAVVIGSAIRMGHWLPEAMAFVEENRKDLSKIPTAYFLVSGFLRDDTPEMRKTILAYIDPVRKILEPQSIGLFAGKIDYHKLSWLDRLIAKIVRSPEGDWRNWEAIQEWGHDLQPLLAHV